MAYIVKSGETLSGILYKEVPGRIYGKNGNLERTKLLNPRLYSVDEIEAGEELILPQGVGEFTQFEIAMGLQKKRETYISENDDLIKFKHDKQIDREKASEKIEPDIKEESIQSLFVGFKLDSTSINAIDSESSENEIAVSELGYGIFLRWIHKWRENLQFFFDGSLARYSFNVSTDKELDESDFTKSYAGVGLKFNLDEKHSFELSSGLGESLLLTSESATILKIEKITIPSLSTSGNHKVFQFENNFSFNLFWRAGVLLETTQADYNTELGSYWLLGASSLYEYFGKMYNISFSYGQRSLLTDDIEQTSKDISVSAGAGFPF